MLSVGKIYSTLGNCSSLIPLGIKDIANGTGMTIGSYITGAKTESKDRFIDEFGTEAIWLFGIPSFKKIINILLYKPLHIDPNIDIRVINNKEITQKAIEYAPNEIIKKSLEKASNNSKLIKGLSLTRFIGSTVLTAISYFALTKFRHHYTEKQIKKDYFAKHNNEHTQYNPQIQFASAFDEIKTKKQTTFTGGIKDFMFNPVKNLMLVDATITGERLTNSRNKQEFVGYAIKEGSLWAFLYFAGDKIQNILEKQAKNKFHKSIKLDARVIESEELKEEFKTKNILKSLKEFNQNKTDIEIYEFINQHPDNFIVKVSKISDIISTIKNSTQIDTRKFIDINKIKETAKELEILFNQYKNTNENLDIFMQGVKKLKRKAILKSIGSCIGVLGIITPTIMVALRLLNKNNNEFQTKKEIEEKLASQN